MNQDNYEDIIHLPHHVSYHHVPMSMEIRAAQFSPFSALTGLEDALSKTAEEAAWMKESADETPE